MNFSSRKIHRLLGPLNRKYARYRYQKNRQQWSLDRSDLPPMGSIHICRILGNDLEPRHDKDQTINCLRFILENEETHPGISKSFLLNKMVDLKKKAEIVDLLTAHAADFIDLPFEPREYAQQKLDLAPFGGIEYFQSEDFRRMDDDLRSVALIWALRHKANNVMGVNGARNEAIKYGRLSSHHVYALDGQCFVPATLMDEFVQLAQDQSALPYIVVPMQRAESNEAALRGIGLSTVLEEPQLGVSHEAPLLFDPERPYGVRSKADLLKSLAVPGDWSHWKAHWFEGEPDNEPSIKHLYEQIASPLIRLSSGRAALDANIDNTPRYQSRNQAIIATIVALDDRFDVPEENQARYLLDGHLPSQATP